MKDINGADQTPECSISVTIDISGDNDGVKIELSGDATSGTLYKAIEIATDNARHPDEFVRKRHNEVVLQWLLDNWGTPKQVNNHPESKVAQAKDEVTQTAPTTPIATIAGDIRALNTRTITLFRELCELKAHNGIKFERRLSEVQHELASLHGTMVTWPATVTAIHDNPNKIGRPPGVYITLSLPRPNASQLIVQFGTPDEYGNQYLSYGAGISKKYAESLNNGDIIRVTGTITYALFPASSQNGSIYVSGYHKNGSFEYHICLSNPTAIEH